MKFFYKFLRCALLLAAMVACMMPANAQQPFTLTKASEITKGTQHYYLIQSIDRPTFYAIPHSNAENSKVSTTSIPNATMRWYFMDAESDSDHQYYYIVSSTGRCLYRYDDNNDGIKIKKTYAELSSLSGDELNKYKFYLEQTGSDYFIHPKGASNLYLNKKGTNTDYSNYIKASTYNDSPSVWNFVDVVDVTWPQPFTISTNADKHYYKFQNMTNTLFCLSKSEEWATVSITSSNANVWYFLDAGTDATYSNCHYYFIVNASTEKYLYYTGGTSNDVAKIMDYNSVEADKYRFLIVDAAYKPNNNYETCYTIVPKLKQDSFSGKDSFAPMAMSDDSHMLLKSDRGTANYDSHWGIVETSYTPVTVEAPTITNSFDGTISLSTTTPSATIYYTTNGDTPNNTSTAYSSAFSLGEATVIKAIAYVGLEYSDVTTYNVPKYTTPTVSFDNITSEVTITCTGATGIYYTTNGSTPTTSSTSYSAPFTVTSPTTIKAIATHAGYLTSEVATVPINQVATPGFVLTNDEKVMLTCNTSGVDFYYEMGADPSDPTPYSTHYTDPIEDAVGMYIKAIAVKDEWINSAVATSELIAFPCAMPVITKTSATTFTIECSYPTSGVHIYYNTGDGSQADPTNTSTEYTEEVTFDENNLPFTVKAIAYADDYEPSAVATLTIEAVHDYSQDYLTFRILESGTICWKAFGSGYVRTIEYSINNGSWTSITSTTDGATFEVSENDVVRFRGSNNTYAGSKSNYSGFEGGTATFNIEGNIHSLLYGDDFADYNSLTTSTYQFCSLFKKSLVISAENLVLPATTLKNYCYRALFSWCTTLEKAPTLPATTLAQGCYWYMFEQCAIETAPDLLSATLLQECYGHMFEGCKNLNYIKCLATTGFSSTNCLTDWVKSVSASGTFVKEIDVEWSSGTSGIPSGWTVYDAELEVPVITCDGEFVTITCLTYGASIYYRLHETGDYSLYSAPFVINENTVVEAYAKKGDKQSNTVSEECIATKSYSFAGMKITPGPLYYGSNGYEIKDGWNYDSYNSVYGKTVGSTYFNFIELGQLFESSVFSTSDGDIEKVLDPLDSWRVPTNAEWASIIGTTRSGSTVNETPDMHYAMIQLADVSGLLIFPDGETITGAELSDMDNTTPNDITESDLNEYLGQGCIFLPGSGFYDSSLQTWDNGLYYWSSTEYDSSTGYVSSGDNKNKESYYLPVYLVKDAADEATRLLRIWTYNGNKVELPYSVNAIDGHSGNYAKGTFDFTTDVKLKATQPTYLWFQHADQSATVYVDNTLVEKHWGGYNAFFVDISSHVHPGTNNIKVAIKNNEGNHLAPCAGDFNFNATLGEVKLISSPVVPAPVYGYDGFHITSTVSAASATITVKTAVPTGATLTCSIKGTNCDYSETKTSTGEEITFTKTITEPHLWNGTLDPYLYDVTLTIAKDGVVYHEFKRGYGLRFYEYVIDNVTPANSRFKLNGSPYLLRGVCMHSDLEGKANALTAADIDNDFEILKELGCNFVRLAHYPHPKEVYDRCDKLGIIVQTEVPWVNQSSSGQPEDYYTNLVGQYNDMVNQHYNHPCILFWGLANEITPSTVSFTKEKIEQYYAQIKALDSERLVGFVMSHGYNNPTSFDSPNIDWFGCNIYVGWYVDKTSNNPTSQLNTRVTNFITNGHKPFAFSEYGCGGSQSCHSEDPWTTTTKGTNQPRHDIEYLMWLHEGHIAAIKNFPQLLFTSQWQLFDIAVYNRQEGYKVCKDGETTSVYDNDELKYLNNKGLVERDHKTKKDPFYLYKAWWNQTDKFVHICGKDYKKTTGRVIKCYTNDGSTLKLYVNNEEIETATVTNNIATFTARTFTPGDVIRVAGDNSDDTFTINNYNVFKTEGYWDVASNWSAGVVPADGTDVDIVANTIIPDGCTADVGNITLYNSTLTIADGGQFVSNSAVNATVEKNIEAYTINQSQGESLTDGWYFIASPVNGASFSTAITSGDDNDYDLYMLDWANQLWLNQKNDDNNALFANGFQRGTGYLYASEAGNTLSVAGEIKPLTAADTAKVVLPTTGWNLIGNPLTCDVSVDCDFSELNGSYAVTTKTSGSIINPCQGIAVYGDARDVVTFTKATTQNAGTPNNSSLQMILAKKIISRGEVSTKVVDNAVVSFNESKGMPKFNMIGGSAKLYIPQNDEEYAVVFSDCLGDVPLNFKTNEVGTYTITVETCHGASLQGVHLIDMLEEKDIDLGENHTYTFIGSPADRTARFKIVFKNNDNANDIFAYQSGSDIVVTGEGELQIFDVMGRLVFTQHINGVETLGSSSLQNGVYILKLNGKTQKIVVR